MDISGPRTLLDWLNQPSAGSKGWAVANAIIDGSTAVLLAPTESFKSWLAMWLLRSMLTGEPWLDRDVLPVSRVWYISNEKSRSTIITRLSVIFSGLDDDVLDRVEIRHNEGILYGNERMRELQDEVRGHGESAFVVLDTHSSLFPSGFNETNSTDGSKVLDAFRGLKAPGVTTLLIGHTALSDPNRLRGWSGIEAAVDDRLIVHRPSKDRTDITVATRPKDGVPGKTKWRWDPTTFGFAANGDNGMMTQQRVAEFVSEMWGTERRSASTEDIIAAFPESSEKTVRNRITDAKNADLIAEWNKVQNKDGSWSKRYMPSEVVRMGEAGKEGTLPIEDPEA